MGIWGRRLDFWVGECELCGGPVVRRNCKYICQNCGHTRDCSDPVEEDK